MVKFLSIAKALEILELIFERYLFFGRDIIGGFVTAC